jgi:anaerobic magnesium-protoporphyrin IX monomethyl ester cyclase
MLTPNKILLVHPLGYKMESAGQDVSRIANIMPPLGLASIAAYLEREGSYADIVDCYAKPFSDRLIRGYLIQERPSFIVKFSRRGPHCDDGEKYTA